MASKDLSTPESIPVVSEKQETPASLDETVEQRMLTGLASLVTQVTNLHQTIEERLSYDKVKEEAFDRLYVEVEEVRQERSFQQLRPLLIDLFLLFDRIDLCRQQVDSAASDFAQLLQSIGDELLEVLYRREVEVIVATSPTFDRTIQQVVGLQPTDSATAHNQVVRVVRRGFRHRNRILRPEEVIVSNYIPTGSR